MISNSILILAQAAPTAVKPVDQGVHMMGMMILAFALVYLITIRPQQKRQKALQAQVSATKTGDKVITASGIHGIIANVKETTFILKIAENVKIEIDKAAVATILKASEAESTDTKA